MLSLVHREDYCLCEKQKKKKKDFSTFNFTAHGQVETMIRTKFLSSSSIVSGQLTNRWDEKRLITELLAATLTYAAE